MKTSEEYLVWRVLTLEKENEKIKGELTKIADDYEQMVAKNESLNKELLFFKGLLSDSEENENGLFYIPTKWMSRRDLYKEEAELLSSVAKKKEKKNEQEEESK